MIKMKDKSKANRGKKLEKLIDDTNELYKELHLASVEKIPTPVKIMSVNGGRVSGVKQRGYIVDYVGVLDGHAIAFDAKETSAKSFPLSNLHQHQFEMLQSWHDKGASVFLVVHFTGYDEYYYLDYATLYWYWTAKKKGGRKSIPYIRFKEHCREINKKGNYLDYLGVLQ